ncbi:MAG: Gfo/Idh/MocA family protein [Rhodospirillales bacterium]
MALDSLNAAVIGLGVGQRHAEAFARAPGCRVRWLYDLDRARAEALAADIDGARAAESFESVLADPETHVVSVASYDDAHARETEAALTAGKHVFVEKPLCRTLPELERIMRAWESAGRPHLAANLVLRAAPLYRWLKDAAAEGVFGRIYAVDGDYLYGRLHKITEGWRKDVEDYSVMEGGGVHMLDIICQTLGEYPVSVSMTGNRLVTAETDFRYDDYQAATFTFPSGAAGRVTANFGCVHRHHHALRVFGTKASLIYDDAGVRLHESCDENKKARVLDLGPLPEHKGALIPDFAAAILEGRDPAPQAQREFNLTAALAACAAARRSGTEEKVTSL